jgi:hypothetical protein
LGAFNLGINALSEHVRFELSLDHDAGFYFG